MVKYSCERCGKGFSQKSHYDSHNRRKTPCENTVDKIKDMVDKLVEEKLKELNNKKLIVDNEYISCITNTTMSELKVQKPFLKWVGGKSQIIGAIISKIPRQMDNYHELFLGGGSVLLAVLSLQKQNKVLIRNKIYAYDVNSVLINVYKNIQSNKQELYRLITSYMTEYDGLSGTIINRNPSSIEEAKTSKESYYYWLRNKYNSIDKSTVECSALFMVINKTCFRGMYREGPNGYNVPYGHYKKTPTIISEIDLNNISDLIKDVEFNTCSFTDSIKNVKYGDFVYLDPPYAPENSKSFVGYVSDGFGLDKHKLLFDDIKKLHNTRFVMSNAKVELVMEAFKEYNCQGIEARRAINSKKPGSTTTEVIIYN
jgi:DNA adenine methylase